MRECENSNRAFYFYIHLYLCKLFFFLLNVAHDAKMLVPIKNIFLNLETQVCFSKQTTYSGVL